MTFKDSVGIVLVL